jgi:hypothetical protein
MTAEDEHRLSRRRFLGAEGAGAGAVALDPASVVASPGQRPCAHASAAVGADRFGRMFRLPAFAPQSPKVEAALRELGRPGGLLDAADPLAAGPKALIVDLSLSANNPNNPSHTAGTTFFGQFLDHDVTFDATSRLARATNPADALNSRTPALDLDDGAQHGAALLSRESRRRRRTAVLRLHLRPVARGQGRPRRPARRESRSAPLHRLADVLRLRRRRGQAEQEDRHEDLDGAVHAAHRRHRDPRRPDRVAATQPAAAPDLAAALRTACRSHDGATPLAPADVQELAALGVGFEHSTPLWYYVLKEAEVVADGLQLGAVGGRIVAEVFIGLLQTDPGSYVATRPRWRQELRSKSGAFRMTDFLTFAGVDPPSRGQ